jgi:hypothetical protein
LVHNVGQKITAASTWFLPSGGRLNSYMATG